MHCLYDKEIETVDIYLYRMSYNKQKNIDKVEEILREEAVDMFYNKEII